MPGSEPRFARFPALLIPSGAFVTVHPCTVTKGFGFLPRPFVSLRAVNPDSIPLSFALPPVVGSSNGRIVKSTLRAKRLRQTRHSGENRNPFGFRFNIKLDTGFRRYEVVA